MLSIRKAIRAGLLVGVATVATVACAQPQPAPPPREAPAPTAAELLVGRWRLVKYGGDGLPPGGEVMKMFTMDGKYITTVKSFGRRTMTSTGTYLLRGTAIDLKVEQPLPPDMARLHIETITKTTLILQHGMEDDCQRSEYVRDEGKN